MPARGVSLVCGARGAAARDRRAPWDDATIAAGEFAENEMRKNFTPSERLAIMHTIGRLGQGHRSDLEPLPDLADVATAAKHSGFGSRQTAEKIAMPAVKAKTPVISNVSPRIRRTTSGRTGVARVARWTLDTQMAAG